MPLSSKDVEMLRVALRADFEASREHTRVLVLEAMEKHYQDTHVPQNNKMDSIAKQVWIGTGVAGALSWIFGFLKGANGVH